MALLGEEVVEEWLNRQGYFTIRGVKIGVDEIDLLAIRPTPEGTLERRHIEVQVSMRPISYICDVPKKQQREGRPRNSAKRSEEELLVGVREWVEKKFSRPRKTALLQRLAPGTWSSELVLHNVKSEGEVDLIRNCGVRIHRLTSIVHDLRDQSLIIQSASGSNLLELIHFSSTMGDRKIDDATADLIANKTGK